MLPSILAKQLEKGIGDYIETTFPMTNAPFRGSLKKFLETKDALYHDPYVSVRLPFRVAEKMPNCFTAIHPAYLPYVHQQTAFDRLTGNDGRSTLIATGTGSGKTECFLYPILEYCYRHRGEPGIKALIIYPMNALATDQAKRIAELIYDSSELKNNVSAGMYVGGHVKHSSRMMSRDTIITDRETMRNQPPDILLTNYKMLDYLLVRPDDASLWKENNPDTLKYIIVDEFHTFDGAQGTDLACLLRRLKSRLWTPAGYLCCVGTSATMGSRESSESILQYAEEVFGEPFEKDAVVTEDRLTPGEFFANHKPEDFTIPTNEQIEALNQLIDDENEAGYIKAAAKAWTDLADIDLATGEGRIALGKHLMSHFHTQMLLFEINSQYYQVSDLIKKLNDTAPLLRKLHDPEAAINALLALISYARTGTPENLRPYLNVQIQFWLRELRRLVANVSDKDVSYSIAYDLNTQQAKHYLPVVNCRDCGATGWTSILNEHQKAAISNLETFYNLYFKADSKVVMMFPHSHDDESHDDMIHAQICPECLQVKFETEKNQNCEKCNVKMVNILIPHLPKTTGTEKSKQYVCPFCGSKRGLSLMGLRSATEISTELSQLFASKFNDDKKILAFSDNVQDASHRAGFFNARTWRFGLRSAIQRYVQNGGAGQSLADFSKGFIQYWHNEMTDESFVSYFIAPNMTWMSAYEDMIAKRKFGNDERSKKLMADIEKRIFYEIMLEYGISSRIGRTLEKSACSCLDFPEEVITDVASVVAERVSNELGGMAKTSIEHYQQMVVGYLKIMSQNGCFDDSCYVPYWEEKGNNYILSNDHVSWMPGWQTGRNTPRFIYQPNLPGKRNKNFDSFDDRKYTDWVSSCSDEHWVDVSVYAFISKIILEELVRNGIVRSIPIGAEFSIFAIARDKVFITNDVVRMKCGKCGINYSVSKTDSKFWNEAPCVRSKCAGRIEEAKDTRLDYFGRLFTYGDLVRINATEHTGMLERDGLANVETDFKRKKDTSQLWDPNVISCTSTLEMGIDIGDLSTVILCSIPPAQAQFLQRTGRAGRKDGNALTMAVAAAKPHDLYFYSDPKDMLDGNIAAPKIFLKASAVLERQFVAYCMDSWVKRGVSEKAIPDNIKGILGKLEKHPMDYFPFNFLNYVQNNLTHLLNSFLQLFTKDLDELTETELRKFAIGDRLKESPMHMKILEAFQSAKKQRDGLTQSIDQLTEMIKELESKPKDSSYDAELKELNMEKSALINVVSEINKKNVFNFLSDEGLLPNYAFPESGIILKAVLHREDSESEDSETNQRSIKTVYEYNRAASSAISEFAPHNSFYVAGRKLTIDQVDLTSAQSAKWRFCPNCSHAEIEEAGKNTASCPNCGSPDWADSGQVQNMLKVQMVYSNADYSKSMISDESDDRSNIFYCKQLLVDVNEEQDVTSAYQMDNKEFAFGYEFVKKATLREINFGESDMVGRKMTVSGKEEVRKGFRICKYCGKVQPEHGRPEHTRYCKTRRLPNFADDPYEESLFLYREFATEALRILIPATTLDSSNVRTESFTAAFMLGMKEYFGNVDHLRATVSEVPVPDAEYKKQYLVIYDSIPGGTGYLKQLMKKQGSLIDILEKALQKLETCSCKDDPQKDGCYHCLYAYRQSRNIGNISRTTAIRLLKSILSGKDNLTKIKKLGNIPVNTLFDSELERRFIEALAQMRNENRKVEISKALVNGKEGYFLKVNNSSWEIEPQVILDAAQGVSVVCKPDFVIRPIGESNRKPVAIFTDGFLYHKDKVADDTLKREAIRRSGRYRVWTLSWKDVQSVFQVQVDYMTQTLAYEKMPSGANMYQPTVKAAKADDLQPGKMFPFELLMCYLDLENAEDLYKAQTKAYSLSLLDPTKIANKLDFTNWNDRVSKVNRHIHFTDEDYVQPGTFFGMWLPRKDNSHLSIYAGILAATMKRDKNAPVSVCALLDDRKEKRTDKYEEEWNGFWHFFNVMQFSDSFVAVTDIGMDNDVYVPLPYDQMESFTDDTALSSEAIDTWSEIKVLLFDEETIKIADLLKEKGISAPEEAGYELIGESEEVIAEIELAWVEKKIGYMTDEQLSDKSKAEEMNWRICSTVDELITVFEEE